MRKFTTSALAAAFLVVAASAATAQPFYAGPALYPIASAHILPICGWTVWGFACR